MWALRKDLTMEIVCHRFLVHINIQVIDKKKLMDMLKMDLTKLVALNNLCTMEQNNKNYDRWYLEG